MKSPDLMTKDKRLVCNGTWIHPMDVNLNGMWRLVRTYAEDSRAVNTLMQISKFPPVMEHYDQDPYVVVGLSSQPDVAHSKDQAQLAILASLHLAANVSTDKPRWAIQELTLAQTWNTSAQKSFVWRMQMSSPAPRDCYVYMWVRDPCVM